MKRRPEVVYVWSVLVGLALAAFVPIAAYVGGYFLLSDKRGLFPNAEMFHLYEPMVRAQRWVTDKPVDTGYVDPKGRRFARRLP